MRNKMPAIAAFFDWLREAIGKELTEQAQREGLHYGGFWAIEPPHIVGNPPPEALARWGMGPATLEAPASEDPSAWRIYVPWVFVERPRWLNMCRCWARA